MVVEKKMKDNFNKAFELMIAHEGGFVNHPADPGGMTNLGVTAKAWAEYTGKLLSNITEAEMRALTVATVQPFYKRRYWDACKCDLLPSGVDLSVFDFAVNSGPKRAILVLQHCLAINADGLIGPETLKYSKLADARELVSEYNTARLDFLQNLRTFNTFGRGWTRRVKKTLSASLELVQ